MFDTDEEFLNEYYNTCRDVSYCSTMYELTAKEKWKLDAAFHKGREQTLKQYAPCAINSDREQQARDSGKVGASRYYTAFRRYIET